MTTEPAPDGTTGYVYLADLPAFVSDDDPVLSMLSDLMEEVRSLRARLDELFPKAEP